MSEYEALRNDIEEVAVAMAGYAGAVSKHVDAVHVTFDQLWADNAELRDELHALANRVETLTRARLTEPAETAARMVPARAVPSDDDRLATERHRAVFGFPTAWRECSECGTAIYTGDGDGLIYDGAGLHTCKASA